MMDRSAAPKWVQEMQRLQEQIMCADYDQMVRRIKEVMRRGDYMPTNLYDDINRWLNSVELKAATPTMTDAEKLAAIKKLVT